MLLKWSKYRSNIAIPVQRTKVWPKLSKRVFYSKIEVLTQKVLTRNFTQKYKFYLKIEILLKKYKFYLKIEILLKKYKFYLKIEILLKQIEILVKKNEILLKHQNTA